MYSDQISQDFQTVHNVDRLWGSHNRQANAACLLRNEALHGRDDAEHSLFHHALLCAKAARLYAKAGTLLALDRPILSRPLTTILRLSTTGLEAWISQAEPTILRCISDANDDHVQANTIDDYFPRHRDG
jgi:hypothetical protein